MAVKVYKLIQLGRQGKSFSKEFQKVIRPKVIIDESIANEANKDCLSTGKMYELDEKKTKERNEQLNKVENKPKKD